MARYRVLVVDDHSIFRRGLVELLREVPALEVMGEAENGIAAVELTVEYTPDVVVMDLRMKNGDGITAIRKIRELRIDVWIMVLSEYDDDGRLAGALRAGAQGYYLKTDQPDDIVRGIMAVASGEAAFSAGVAQRVLMLLASLGPPSRPATSVFPQLSRREYEVLELLAQGKGNAVIGRVLGITLKTVKNHVSAILKKLQSTDRAEAATKAREQGLGATRDSGSQPT
ncbi:MAG: response regulator transcription factor [Gemmatimonadota bacterium]|nr:response regulator transcription factor [Gemmatimonadota bacterium]